MHLVPIFQFIDFFLISDLPESEVATSQNQIFGCGPIDAHHVVQEKGSF